LGETASKHSSLIGFVRRATTYVAPEVRRSPDDPNALPRAPEAEPYVARVRAWVRTARAFGIEPVLVTEPLSTLRNELTPPWTDAGALNAFNQKVREIGREENAVVIDLAELVQAEPAFAKPETIYYDGMHVNDEGARIYGRLVAQALARDVLPRLRAARAAQPPQIAR
jgi:lysophospholipase L1-like esterase